MMELNDMPKEGSNCMQLHQQSSALYRPYTRTVGIKLQMSELQSSRVFIFAAISVQLCKQNIFQEETLLKI